MQMPKSAVLIGSVAPDVPLYLLSVGGLIYFHKFRGLSLSDSGRHIYGDLYFNDPGWIGLHSLLHSPVSILAGLLIVQATKPWWPRAARWVQWLLFACLLHSAVDIVTHFDDGPLLFWPLDWRTRFASPVSYWDPAHFGREFFLFEATLAIVLAIYLIRGRARDRVSARAGALES